MFFSFWQCGWFQQDQNVCTKLLTAGGVWNSEPEIWKKKHNISARWFQCLHWHCLECFVAISGRGDCPRNVWLAPALVLYHYYVTINIFPALAAVYGPQAVAPRWWKLAKRMDWGEEVACVKWKYVIRWGVTGFLEVCEQKPVTAFCARRSRLL